MNYIVTARKWRPIRFEEVVGQEHITTTLKNAIRNNRVAHAFIFAGPRGVGKTTTARILAKALNCSSPVDAEPCNECEMCRSFNSSQSLDIIEIDGASNRRIEEIRTLRESVKYAPTKGEYKVYIIDEVHMLTNESFNALLKTLEEPPEHTIFIFATTDVHKVPLTIISRCQRFDFRRIELTEIKSLLKKIANEENIEIDDQSLTIIAKKADGALRDAESIFDQIISFSGNKVELSVVSKMLNLIDEDVFFQISDAIISKNFKTAFDLSKMIYDNGWSYIDFLNGLLEHFRNLMTVVVSGNTNLIESAEIYKTKYLESKEKFTESDLLRILNHLNKIMQELRFSQNQRIKIEVALCHLIGLERSSSIETVISQLQELKKKVPTDENNKLKDNSSEYRTKNTYTKEVPVVINTGFSIQNSYSHPDNIIDHSSNDITRKWKLLIEDVNQEKIFLGSALSNLKFLGAHNNKISVHSKDPSIQNMLDQNKKYLEGKFDQHFGNGYKLMQQDNYTSQPPKEELQEENNLTKLIINELGGEEIN